MKGELFSAIYQQFANQLYRYAYSLCKQDAMAKDLVADTFIKAFEYLPEEHVNIEAWMYQVLYHLYLDQQRKRKRHPLVSLEQFPFLPAKEEPKDSYEKKQRSLWLQKTVLALPESYRLVVYLFYFHQKSIQEIAQELSLSTNNVKIRLCRGRRYLKKEMEELTDEMERSI